MKFQPTPLSGVYRIDWEPIVDERGYFVRTFCEEELRERGLDAQVVQCSRSFNHRKGTLRGLHFQRPPRVETKFITCLRGAIFDVLLDLRRGSPTFGKWCSFELDESARSTLYVPKGVAHGLQTVRDDTEIFYQITTAYHAESAGGVRCDDPSLAIPWPIWPPVALSPKDAALPLLEQLEPLDA